MVLLIAALLMLPAQAHAHQGHHPSTGAPPAPPPPPSAVEKIAEGYRARVEPIFRKKCFDCHGNTTVYPWYYKLPLVRQYIDHDISEAKEHLDFSPGYPFKSHASPEEDLKAIAEDVDEGDMPPFGYRIFHSETKLTEEEKAAIDAWVREAQGALATGKR